MAPAADTHLAAGHIRVVDTHQAVDHTLAAGTRRVAGHILAVGQTLAADTHQVAGHILAAAADYRDLLAEVVLEAHTHHTDLVDLGLDPDLDSNSCSNSSFLHDMSSKW